VAPPKRFLVIVRAGDHSLHPQWTSSLVTRDWDLAVSYFGDDSHRYRDAGELRIDDKGPKWPGLHALLSRDDFWRGYDYIWLPDDDLSVTQSTISALFEVSASRDLALTQPALSWSSFYSYPVTIRLPSFELRLTNFVEIMAPCFKRSALEICLPTMGHNLSGWGLSWVWPSLLSGVPPRVAIIDRVTVTHTRRPGGPNYETLRTANISPWTEKEELMRKSGIPLDIAPQVLAAIDREGHLLDREDPDDSRGLEERLRRDWSAFLASRQRLDTPAVVLPPMPLGRAKWGW